MNKDAKKQHVHSNDKNVKSDNCKNNNEKGDKGKYIADESVVYEFSGGLLVTKKQYQCPQ